MTDTPLPREPPHHVEQLLGLGQRQRRRRLVEDQDAAGRATAPWRSRRSAPAPATAATLSAPGRWRRRAAAISAWRLLAHRAHVDLAEPVRRLPAGEDVLGDRKLRHQRAFLVDDADAEVAGRLLVDVADLRAVDQDGALRRANRRRPRSCRASTCRRRSRRAARGSRRPRRSSTTSSSARTPGKEIFDESPVILEPRRHGRHGLGLRLRGSARSAAWIIQTIVSLCGVGDADAAAGRRRWRR